MNNNFITFQNKIYLFITNHLKKLWKQIIKVINICNNYKKDSKSIENTELSSIELFEETKAIIINKLKEEQVDISDIENWYNVFLQKIKDFQ